MNTITQLAMEDYVTIQSAIAQQARGCATLEEAAQQYMSVLYENFGESIVLARLFATIPMKQLPDSNKRFVTQLAQSSGISDLIRDDTLVLSLLATRGTKLEWNDRRESQGHVGIPLVSSNFIDRIPMISRLLKELGAGIEWLDSNDTQLVVKTFEKLNGVFYVLDAASEVDQQGRKVIAAQNFVEEEGVKTVFGYGGCYLGTSLFFATIIFLREFLDKSTAEHFMLQANKFKTATLSLVNDGRIFA